MLVHFRLEFRTFFNGFFSLIVTEAVSSGYKSAVVINLMGLGG